MHPKPSAIIIGSGVAGIALSVRLALQGYEVRVFERNSMPGGKMGVLEQDGFQFDTGPSLFTMPENIEELFAEAGENMDEYLRYEAVDITCRYFFENGKVINAFSDQELFAAELENKTGEAAANLSQYLDASKKLYQHIGQIFLNFSLQKPRTWFHRRILRAFAHLKYAYLFRSLDHYNKTKFTSPEARQIFNRFATYNGSNPFHAPAMLSIIPHLELNKGVYYPKGGMISIIEALQKLAIKKGVKFFMNQPVKQIIYADEKAKGVVVNDKNEYADIVISNADIYFTWKNLVGRADIARKIAKPQRSSSALVFYWGISRQFEELDLHNIFFSENYKQEFDAIFGKKLPSADPTIYINITSKKDASHAPPGQENWFVMINVPPDEGQNWPDITARMKKIVIAKLSKHLHADIGSLIASEAILDPAKIGENTLSYMGSLYGASSNSRMAAFKRPANYSKHIRDLFFCGGTVHPGGGIPLCLKSAKITAELVASKKHSHKTTH
jgi:phytoene desaturase